MRGLVVNKNGELSIETLSLPRYNDCQALVRTVSCGVCNGTDMKLIHGTFKNMTEYPMVLGHEAVGRVVEVGAKVTKYKIGDLVLLPFLYEKNEGNAIGWGGYSEYTVISDSDAYIRNGLGPGTDKFDEASYGQTIIRSEDQVDEVSAVMIITFREVLSAIKRFGFKANQSVVIFGAGPVGLCFTKFAKMLGLSPVITVDVMDDKIDQARKQGADIVFNSTKVDINTEIRNVLPNGTNYVVDAVGINALLNQGMNLIADHGMVCGYGISPKLGMDLDWSRAPYNWSLSFVQFPVKSEEAAVHNQIMAWINSGALNPKDFISDVFDFDQILDAFELVEKRLQTTRKIVIRFPEAIN